MDNNGKELIASALFHNNLGEEISDPLGGHLRFVDIAIPLPQAGLEQPGSVIETLDDKGLMAREDGKPIEPGNPRLRYMGSVAYDNANGKMVVHTFEDLASGKARKVSSTTEIRDQED